MRQFTPSSKRPLHRSEPSAPPGIYKPSGELYKQPVYRSEIDVQSVLGGISSVLEQNTEVLSPLSAAPETPQALGCTALAQEDHEVSLVTGTESPAKVIGESCDGISQDNKANHDQQETLLTAELKNEEYRRSLRAYRYLGALAIKNKLHTSEGSMAKEALWRDWLTTIAEMLENSDKFRGRAEINDMHNYLIIDGQVCMKTAKGHQPIVQMVRDGAAVSMASAKMDPRMSIQARRDAADVWNAERVDSMAAGHLPHNTRLAISKSPREAIAKDPEFWKSMGYREDLSFIQLYYVEGSSAMAGTFSIDNVSDETIDAVLAENGVHMPENASSDDGVRYGIECKFANKEEAVAFAKSIRKRCRELQGDTKQRRSINEFLDSRYDQMRISFDALCMPLSQAIASGTKTPAIHEFVAKLLQAPHNLEVDVRARLQHIYNSNEFDHESGRLIDDIVLYGIVESLYSDTLSAVADKTAAYSNQHNFVHAPAPIHLLANNVLTGVSAGRKHGGGCRGSLEVGSGSNGGQSGVEGESANPQEAYGGKASGEESEESAKIPKIINCIKCRKASPKEKVVKASSWQCPHCRYEIDICTGAVLHESVSPKKSTDVATDSLKDIFGKKKEQQVNEQPDKQPPEAEPAQAKVENKAGQTAA